MLAQKLPPNDPMNDSVLKNFLSSFNPPNYAWLRATEFHNILKYCCFTAKNNCEGNSPNILCKINTCDARHFVGEVALLQILKVSRQPLPPRRQCAVVPRLSFALANKQKTVSQCQDKVLLSFFYVLSKKICTHMWLNLAHLSSQALIESIFSWS